MANSLSKRVYAYTSEQHVLRFAFSCRICLSILVIIVMTWLKTSGRCSASRFQSADPLILETRDKATQNYPRQMQTGPTMRGDHNIFKNASGLIGSRAATCTCRSLCANEPQIQMRHQS